MQCPERFDAIFQLWQDYLLSWNSSDYDDVAEVRIPARDIWKPDLVLYN